MDIKDQVNATLSRRDAKAHLGVSLDASKRNRQQQLNDMRKTVAHQRLVELLAKHRPDITLVRYYDTYNVVVECDGVQKCFEAKYIKAKYDRLFGGLK